MPGTLKSGFIHAGFAQVAGRRVKALTSIL
jgi:hypothetical protein